MADGGDLGVGHDHRLSREAAAHHVDLRGFVLCARLSARPHDRPHLRLRDRAHHRTDVSIVHLFHDHGSENHGPLVETGPVRGSLPGCRRRSSVTPDAERARTLLRAVHRGTVGDLGRDLVDRTSKYSSTEKPPNVGPSIVTSPRQSNKAFIMVLYLNSGDRRLILSASILGDT